MRGHFFGIWRVHINITFLKVSTERLLDVPRVPALQDECLKRYVLEFSERTTADNKKKTADNYGEGIKRVKGKTNVDRRPTCYV